VVDDPTPPRLPRSGLVQIQPAGVPPVDEPALPSPVPAARADASRVAASGDAPATDAGRLLAEPTSPWPAVEPDSSPSSSVEFPPERAGRSHELSFEIEKPREGRLGRRLAAAAAVALIVGGAGYASWSWDVRDGLGTIGPVPPGPVLGLDIPDAPRGVPPPEEIEEVFRVQVRPYVPRPPVDEPELVETPPEAAIPMAPDIVPTFPDF
jgi:hypothetical protein